MATLLMRLQGPMQSWGTTSRFDERDTQLEPSKSGVLGLVCAALGRDRSEPLEDLASLRMGVRVDREGIPLRDYQTATGVLVASGKADPRRTVVSPRHYLADAVFLVGLEGRDQALLERIQQALRAPFWPLCLGRKSFVPGSPVWLPEGLSSLALEQALQAWPRLAEAQPGDRGKPLRCLIEDERSGVVRLDQPIAPLPNAVSAHASYARESRMYLTRLTLDPRSAQARRDLGDAYEMHRTLSRVFADEQAPASRFLWRLEASGNAWSTPTLLVQAASEGNWSVLQALPGYLLGEPQSKSLALRQWLESDISYRFRLFANPTVTRQGKRYGLVGEEQQLAWLARQGERHGFVVEAALVTFSEVLGSRKRQTRISVLRAAFEGRLRISRPDAFGQALVAGIGPAKAFGCGLLSLARS